nr:PAS domain S-box protein [Bacteroidota bacterium]
MKQYTILIVDNSEETLLKVESVLNKMPDLVPLCADSGTKALDLIKNHSVDLIIMDIDLGEDMDGIDYMMAINRTVRIPVLYMTILWEPKVMEKAKKTSPYGYLLKPISPQQLMVTTDMCLTHIKLDHQIRQRESDFTLVFDSIKELIFICDMHHRIVEANAEICNILDYPYEEMVGMAYRDLMPKTSHKEFDRVMVEFEKSGSMQFETLLLTKNKEEIPVEVNLSTGNYMGKKVKLCIANNICKRLVADEVRVEGKIKKAKDRFRVLTRYLSDVILITDELSKITFASDAVFRALGNTPEELLKLDFLQLIHPEDQENFAIRFEKIKEKAGNKFEMIIRLKTKTNDWKTFECNFRNLTNYDNIGGIAIGAHEITERINAEEKLQELVGQMEYTNFELKRTVEELDIANVTKDKFFSIIAHDLKNPFNAILGFCNLLYDDYDDFTESMRINMIEKLKVSSEKTYKLLENLLEWSRLQRGKMEFYPEKIDIYSLLFHINEQLETQAEKKSIRITSSVSTDKFAYIDKYMIATVIRNLISNAIKFTPKNGSVFIDIQETKADFYQLSVEDTGIGISKETLDLLFKIESNTSTRGTEGESGTGLGLILCEEFVVKNGGEIWVESQPNKGSTFFFTVKKWANNIGQSH